MQSAATPSPTSLAVVLGAGGTFGWPFHLGALAGLAEVTGSSISDATRVIGTSAGAAMSAATLTGRSADEVLAIATIPPDESLIAEVAAIRAELKKPTRWLRPASFRMGLQQLFKDPIIAAVGFGPVGLFPTWPIRRFADLEASWPDSLWITAVDMKTGETVVLGRDVHAPLPDAIEASGTIPILMQPKWIDDLWLTDGAVTSATHGTLLVPGAHDLVFVSSPMTRPGFGPVKFRARRHLTSEFAELRKQGARVVVVEPTAAVVEMAEGFPRERPEAGSAVAAAAKELAIQALQRALSA